MSIYKSWNDESNNDEGRRLEIDEAFKSCSLLVLLEKLTSVTL